MVCRAVAPLIKLSLWTYKSIDKTKRDHGLICLKGGDLSAETKEFEKKALAGEVLDKYRELNIIYDITEKMAASSELKAMAKLAIDEAGRLIQASAGSVMLLRPETGVLRTIAFFGPAHRSQTSLKVG